MKGYFLTALIALNGSLYFEKGNEEVDNSRSAIKEMLIKDEGWRNKPYRCPAGKLTIGVGHNLDANGLSDDVIEDILDEDIDKAEKFALEVFGSDFHEFKVGRKMAIVSMIFQIGTGGFRKFHRTIKAMKEKRWADAADSAMRSLWARQTPARARRVTEMLRTGKNIYGD